MKTSKRALKALKGSIKKWEKIVNGTGADWGASNCPLCKLYYGFEDFHVKCSTSCPIAKLHEESCRDTPFQEWIAVQIEKKEFGYRPETAKEIKLAKAELRFLKRLYSKLVRENEKEGVK